MMMMTMMMISVTDRNKQLEGFSQSEIESCDVFRPDGQQSVLSALYTVQKHTHTDTHTHPFNGPFSGTTRVIRYQKGKTNLDFTDARDSVWQWHQLGHM